MVYFMQPTDGGPIKIGCTRYVETRRRQLEFRYGRSLVLLATMRGGRRKERKIHQRFAHARLGRTEQFRPVPELMELIGRPLLVDANPDAIEVMEPVSTQTSVIHLKGTDEYRDWIAGLSKKTHIPQASIVRLALAEWATRNGHKAPPEK